MSSLTILFLYNMPNQSSWYYEAIHHSQVPEYGLPVAYIVYHTLLCRSHNNIPIYHKLHIRRLIHLINPRKPDIVIKATLFSLFNGQLHC